MSDTNELLADYLNKYPDPNEASTKLASKLENEGPADVRVELLTHGIQHRMYQLIGRARASAKDGQPEAKPSSGDKNPSPLRSSVPKIKAPRTIPGPPAKTTESAREFLLNTYTIGHRPIAECFGRDVKSLIQTKRSTIETHAQDIPWLEWIAERVGDDEKVGDKVDLATAQDVWDGLKGKVSAEIKVA